MHRSIPPIIPYKKKKKKKLRIGGRGKKKPISFERHNDYTSFQSFSNFACVTMTKWKHLPIQLFRRSNAQPLDY